MSDSSYSRAMKLGEKEVKKALSQNSYPYLPALDEFLPYSEIQAEVPLGLVDIPLDQIAGTKTAGRQNAFARNYMPVMPENSEFANKWAAVLAYQTQEGVGDPVIAYEFMNRYYILEGNKRVSVLKYLGAYSIEGQVTRLVPRLTNDPQVRIFYEYMEFYRKTAINYLWFSREGSFPALIRLCGKGMDEIWTDEEKQDFSSSYTLFQKLFLAKGGKKLAITCADAFLLYLRVYPYQELSDKTQAQLSEEIDSLWKEFPVLEVPPDDTLLLDPEASGQPGIFTRFFGGTGNRKLKVAFIYDRPFPQSGWIYSHELGRLHLEQVFGQNIQTSVYSQGPDNPDAEALIEKAAQDGSHVIFVTSERLVSASLKTALRFPHTRILCCCLNKPSQAVRTYYGRMYEAKFLAGVIAGAMTDNNRVAYAADYPIYGSLANINAFARGAAMVNPACRVYLHWNCLPGADLKRFAAQNDLSVICGVDMIRPDSPEKHYGLYRLSPGGYENLAAPIWNWGKFYEKMIRDITSGVWREDEKKGRRSINYLWGISGGIIDLIVSKKVPPQVVRLTDILRSQIYHGVFNPFEGPLVRQDGSMAASAGSSLSLEEIITMDWLCQNVEGSIPKFEELDEKARDLMSVIGVVKPAEEQLRMPPLTAGQTEELLP